MERKHKHHRRGFSIIDSVLALFVVGTMILLYGSLIGAREINRRTLYRAQAAALADEEINALRRLGYTKLTNPTDGLFKNVLYNAGQWKVASDRLELVGGSITTISGRLLFPAGAYDNGVFKTDFNIAGDSPANSAIGFFFRAADKDNGYRLRVGLSNSNVGGSGFNLVLDKIVGGIVTSLRAINTSVTISANTTYNLEIRLAASPTIDLYINGSQQGASGISDAAFTSGAVALIGWNRVHAYFDDVTESGITWNFNGLAKFPAAWTRLGINNLPDATPNVFDDNGKLTIANYSGAASNLKQVTVRVEWLSNGLIQNYTSTVLIGKSTLGL